MARVSRLVVTAVAIALGVASAGTPASADAAKAHRVVYHLDEPSVEKAGWVLRNIGNHIAGVGGAQNITIELVVIGPALRNFVTATIDPALLQALTSLQRQGVTLAACGNTMKAFDITLAELPRGTKPLPQGGVVRLMELQEQGYSYIRP